LNINYLTSSNFISYPSGNPFLFILQKIYKDNKLNKGNIQGKMGIETRNIIRDSKNTTSSKH
jgi:hypothetical protein